MNLISQLTLLTGGLLAALQQPLLPGRAAAAAAGCGATTHRGDLGAVGADPGHGGAAEVGPKNQWFLDGESEAFHGLKPLNPPDVGRKTGGWVDFLAS